MRFVVPLLIGLAGVAILVSLGAWQLRRLDWKEGVLSEIEARLAASPVAVPADPTEATDKFLIVRAAGRYTDDEIHVLVSVKGRGAGYRLISAFEMDRGQRILVDRGFLPTDEKSVVRETCCDVRHRRPALASGTGPVHARQ